MSLPVRPTARGMRPADVARLLTLIAAYDQRTIGDPDVEAWTLVAHAGNWQLAWALRAVVEHYGVEPDRRIMPGHITKAIRDRQARYVASFLCPPLPNGMHDTDEQTAWMRAQRSAHVADRMDRWAAGEDVPR